MRAPPSTPGDDGIEPVPLNSSMRPRFATSLIPSTDRRLLAMHANCPTRALPVPTHRNLCIVLDGGSPTDALAPPQRVFKFSAFNVHHPGDRPASAETPGRFESPLGAPAESKPFGDQVFQYPVPGPEESVTPRLQSAEAYA